MLNDTFYGLPFYFKVHSEKGNISFSLWDSGNIFFFSQNCFTAQKKTIFMFFMQETFFPNIR